MGMGIVIEWMGFRREGIVHDINPESASATGLFSKSLTQPKVVCLEVKFASFFLLSEY